MKKTKLILTSFVMVALVLTTAIFAGCGGGGLIWGNTFKFKDDVSASWTISEEGVATAEASLKKNFDNLDLTKIYHGYDDGTPMLTQPIDTTSQTFNNDKDLYNFLKNYYITQVKDNTPIEELTLTFGTEEAKTFTVDDGTTTLNCVLVEEVPEGAPEGSTPILNGYMADENGEAIKLAGIIMSLYDAEYSSNRLYVYSWASAATICIKLKTPVTDSNNITHEYFNITFSCNLTKV